MLGTTLGGVALQGAIFEGAALNTSSFSGSSLKNVDFTNAFLGGVDFTFSKLGDTKFKHSQLQSAVLEGLDLSEATNLATATTFGGATVGMQCLERTAVGLARNPGRKGDVELFLRDAGLSDPALDFFRSLIGNPIDFYSCFISYSHADKPFARRLFDRLQGDGIRCWLDEHQVLPGDDIYDRIDRGIRIWDKVLLLCSFHSLTSWWVGDEIDKAHEKEQRLRKERGEKVHAIVPLKLDDTIEDWEDGRASSLRRRAWADFTDWKDNDAFEAAFERVKLALRTDVGARGEEPEGKL